MRSSLFLLPSFFLLTHGRVGPQRHRYILFILAPVRLAFSVFIFAFFRSSFNRLLSLPTDAKSYDYLLADSFSNSSSKCFSSFLCYSPFLYNLLICSPPVSRYGDRTYLTLDLLPTWSPPLPFLFPPEPPSFFLNKCLRHCVR